MENHIIFNNFEHANELSEELSKVIYVLNCIIAHRFRTGNDPNAGERKEMLKVNFHELNTIEDNKLLFAVIMAKFNGKWIYVKHKKRQTLEIPGGHREPNENIIDTASRELF